jgi:hypothetical protein
MWMVKVESHREFWKCHAYLLECGKCNLEFSCVPSFVPANTGIEASRLSLLTDPKSKEIWANSEKACFSIRNFGAGMLEPGPWIDKQALGGRRAHFLEGGSGGTMRRYRPKV